MHMAHGYGGMLWKQSFTLEAATMYVSQRYGVCPDHDNSW